MSEGNSKLKDKLKKEGKESSQALVLMVETSAVPCFGAFGALATFISSAGYRLIQINPRRDRGLVISKRYSLLGGFGELEGSVYFFPEKNKAERLTHLALVLYVIY